MKKLFVLAAALFFLTAGAVFAEGGLTPGCTDPTASNYNPNAQSDNGSCIGGQQNANVQQIQAASAQKNAPAVSPSGFTALAPIPGLTDISPTAVVNSDSLANFFNNLYKYLIGLAAVLAVIMITWGGLEIALNKENVSSITDAKGKIYNAIFGLVLVLSPVLVFSIINPAILNLSLNLPELDTKSAQTKTSTFGTGNATAAVAADCSVALGNGTVGCPSQAAAQAFAASCSNNSGQIFSTNDPKLPYSASCNTLQPFQGHRDYVSVAEIPKGYWCYTVKVISGATASLVYVCQVSKDSCSSLALNNPVSGTIVGSGGCTQY